MSDLLTRAVVEVMPREVAEEKIRSGKQLRVYFGIDPTGSKLHLGHAVVLRKLKAFADAGHKAIFLIGSYTAMIGDPTGRDTMRQPLTKEEVEKNFETYKEQASRILDFSKIEIRYNHEWLEKLSGADIMKIASNFTVQQMLQRDMFRERLEKEEDLSPAEFLYPLMQGYDSVMLDVDCEIGGNDQLFNMLCGRKLQKRYGKRDKFVLTTKLLEGTDGRKMSKTYDNCIWLEDSPEEMYGKLLRVKDDLIVSYLELATELPLSEVKELEKQLKKGVNPKEIKMRLAREVTALYHGKDAAAHAEAEFTNVFTKHELPEDMPEIKAKKGSTLVDLIVENKLASSKSEARRLMEQGAVKLDDEVIKDFAAAAKPGVLKVGKRKFAKIL